MGKHGSYILNSLKGVISGTAEGTIGLIKGDVRTLAYSSHGSY